MKKITDFKIESGKNWPDELWIDPESVTDNCGESFWFAYDLDFDIETGEPIKNLHGYLKKEDSQWIAYV